MTNRFYKTIEHGQIYFCQNSLDFLEQQLLDRHIGVSMRKSRIILATFKRWLCQNVSLSDRRGYIIFSGAVLYAYGIRNIHDIDIYIDVKSYTNEVEQYLIDKDTRFYFVDTTMPNTSAWKAYWHKWGNRWAQMMGADDFNDVVYNPKFHFYYMGMKFLCLNGDIERRLIRQRPRSMVDLIKINQLLNMNIKITSIPMTQKKYIRLTEGETIDVESLDDNQTYNAENNEIECEEKVDFDRFLGTMQWYMKTMYREEWDIEDIKPLVGIKNIKMVRIKIIKEEPQKMVKIRIKN